MARSSNTRFRGALAAAGELVFTIDALVVAVFVGFVVIAGVNPLATPALAAATLAMLAILAAHHLWYVRHRTQVEHDRGRLAARERRGF